MTGTLRDSVNRWLDRLVRPEIRVFRQPRSTFQVFSYLGAILGVVLTTALVLYLGLSLWVMGGLVLAITVALLAHLALVGIFPNYHLQLTVIGTATAFLWLVGQPILPYLDVIVLGLGLVLVCGRIGCFMVGCCHGRPFHWGVCYREEHAATARFTPYYVGLRLFPIQAVESLWMVLIACITSVSVLSGQAPGIALTWYAVAYAIGRFGFEFVRGDPVRPYYRGFSEAQWISLFVVSTVAALEWIGLLPFHALHLIAASGLAASMAAVALYGRFSKTAKRSILHPHHVKEIAEIVDYISNPATTPERAVSAPDTSSTIEIGHTSLGLQLSTGKIADERGGLVHYALSKEDGTLLEKDADVLASLILQLQHHAGSSELMPSKGGVFHLLMYPANTPLGASAPIN